MFIKGEIVAVCYDGKWGRVVRGEVISVGPGKKPEWLKVKFIPWCSDSKEYVELLVQPKTTSSYGGWLCGEGQLGIMWGLGCEGDWYSVFKKEELEKEGYKV